VGLAGGRRPHPRAIIFDLDRALIDSRNAWRYCVEESVAAATGRRPDPSALVGEYHIRPWRDALRVLVPPADEQRCEELCSTMYERSAMKKLLVHEGVGMALDALRGERIELGAVSRLPHPLALKQVQSTGLDRFLAVLSATPANERWSPRNGFATCLAFLEAAPPDCAFVSGDARDLDAVSGEGAEPFVAGWAPARDGHAKGEAVASPSDLLTVVMRRWPLRGRPVSN
jgi:phosphoglycolate phosphatase-like HAD superfamily hydrolase